MTSSQAPRSEAENERLAAWKLDDPEWVKNRKKTWREVKGSPLFGCLLKWEVRLVKTYFLTGFAYLQDEDWESLYYNPDRTPLPVSAAEMFECWLDPEPTEERWGRVRARANLKPKEYFETVQHFMRCLGQHIPEQGPLFNGLDERLYRFFCKGRCRREDYPDLKDGRYHTTTERISNSFLHQINAYFQPEFNPHLIAPSLLDEWFDATLERHNPKWEDSNSTYAYLKELLRLALGVIENQSNFVEQQVVFAKRLIEKFRSADMPPEMAKSILSVIGE